MQDIFFTTRTCARCGRSLDGLARTMSRFNTDCLCPGCAEEKRRHPDYQKACDAEREAVLRGDRDFPGIGWPGKDVRL